MYEKTVLHAGDYMSVVPLGLPLTLQYSDKGALEKVFEGHGEKKKRIDSQAFLKALSSNKTLPFRIPIKDGTTRVQGVLYTRKKFYSNGSLPSCISNEIIEDYVQNQKDYNFFAGNVESLACTFRGAAAVRNWLTLAKFKLLPGWIVPYGMNKAQFRRIVNTANFQFEYPLIVGYIIFRGSDVLYESADLHQFKVTKVVKYVDEYGHIRGKVYGGDASSDPVYANYSDIVNYNINSNTLVVLTGRNSIIYSTVTDNKKRDSRSPKITCSTCGRPITVPKSGEVMCGDPHCMSKGYPQVKQFLSVLRLPEISYSKYLDLVESKKLTCLSDILLLDLYKDIEIGVTLSSLLSAVVPVSDVPDKSIFSSFANRCKNSVKTLMYYIHHADLIISDIGLDSIMGRKFVAWLNDPYNLSTLTTIIESSNIRFKETDKRFDGPPIFRGKTIMITGRFLHGDEDEICSILNSYSAKVVTELTDSTDCVIVGGLLENIDGVSVSIAKDRGLPVFAEQAFFTQYDIDKDLAENL